MSQGEHSGEMDQSSAIIRRLLVVPAFLMHPRTVLNKVFGANYRPGKGVIFGAGYFILGVCVFYAIGAAREMNTSRLQMLMVGHTVLWVMYGLFMHLFVWIWGGRGGFFRTIDAYVSIVGLLQPVIAFVFFALTFLYTLNYTCTSPVMGGSGGTRYMNKVVGGLHPSGIETFNMISAVLICSYMVPAFAVAHRLPLWRGIAASATPVALFFLSNLLVVKWGTLIGVAALASQGGVCL